MERWKREEGGRGWRGGGGSRSWRRKNEEIGDEDGEGIGGGND